MLNTIIQQSAEKFISGIEKIFTETIDINEIDNKIQGVIKEVSCDLVSARLEEIDAAIVADESGRANAGITIHRRRDTRVIEMKIGELKFRRAYYKVKSTGEYVYLLDRVAGIEKNERINRGLSEAMANAAIEMSYRQSVLMAAEGRFTTQTVMNKLRRCEIVPVEIKNVKKIKYLHVDADEDHITLRGGKKSEVKLVSIYEGIEKTGERGECIGIFHVSGYGMEPEVLWENVLTEIERRYDFDDDAVIYLHGDGALWIKSGVEELPFCKFVLDPYHKNKTIRVMLVGCEDKDVKKKIYKALYKADTIQLAQARDELIAGQPERGDKIKEAYEYLESNIDAIHIRDIDPEAKNGGCTEPHISNVLSRRLSSRPMAWSDKTLRVMVPALATKNGVRMLPKDSPNPSTIAMQNMVGDISGRIEYKPNKMPWGDNPDFIGNIAVSSNRHNYLQIALNSLAHDDPRGLVG